MQAPVLLGNPLLDVLTDGGHILAQGARGIIDLGTRARGDSADMVINQDTGPTLQSTILISALVAAGLYLVVKK